MNENKEQILREAAVYLSHLMGCALRDEPARPKPDTITWENVFRLAMRNSVQGLAWFGAKSQLDELVVADGEGSDALALAPDSADVASAPDPADELASAPASDSMAPDNPVPAPNPAAAPVTPAAPAPAPALASLRAQWEREANRVLFRRARFDMERAQILELMAQHGLSFLPLKGIHLATYYPRPEMRAMCDNDILYGYVEPAPAGGFKVRGATPQERYRTTHQAVDDLVGLMTQLGYETNLAHKGNHEVFLKPPFFNFEMHRNLASLDSAFHEYYENPWSRAQQDPRNPHMFRFSHEDEYVYMIVHAFKHFDHAGCGVRILADVWVFNQAKGALVNWDYVSEELKTLGLADFERRIRELALHGLDGGELSSDQVDLLCYMAGSGTYGTVRQRMENAAKKLEQESERIGSATAKARYFWQRMFGTGEAFLEQNYPFFYRHKLARPLFPLYRIFRALTRNQASTLREAKTVLRSGKPKNK